ncbi:MAG: hypothetical protein J0L84_13210 [Verrucomicrobia bacterium]|nr:hypothetical protein [Verrucomicrobiota bacterium]
MGSQEADAEGQDNRRPSRDSNLALDGIALSNRFLTLGPNPAISFDGRRHQSEGNILLLGDGCVQQVNSARLKGQIREAAQVSTNTFAIP